MSQNQLIQVQPFETQKAVDAINTHGLVILKQAVPTEPLILLRERMDQDTAELLAYCDTIGGNPRDLGHLQQGPPKSPEFVFAEVVMNQYVNEICKLLYGNQPKLTFYNGNTNCPGSTTQGLHMDGTHHTKHPDPVHLPKAVVVNIPTGSMSPENGAIQLWPGSHMIRSKGERNLIDHETIEEREKQVPPVQPTTEVGDILIRDVRLWHRGVPNPSDRPRHMIALIVSTGEAEPPARLKFEKGCEYALENRGVDSNAQFIDGPVEYLIGPTRRIYETRKNASIKSN